MERTVAGNIHIFWSIELILSPPDLRIIDSPTMRVSWKELTGLLSSLSSGTYPLTEL